MPSPASEKLGRLISRPVGEHPARARRQLHTASNLVLLEWIAGRGGLPVMVDEDNEVRFLEGPAELRLANRPPYRYLSLIPLDRTVTGVTLRGLKYPLTGATLTRGDTLSVSNEPQAQVMEISLTAGRALLIRSQRN